MIQKVTDILSEAKDLVWKNKMQSFIAVVLPVIIAGVAILFSLLFGRLAFILMLLIMITLLYATTKMQLSVVRTGNAYMNESLNNFGRAFKLTGYYVLVALVFGLVVFGLVYALVWDELIAFGEFISSIEFAGVEEIEAISLQLDQFISDFRVIGIVLMILNVIFTLKFFMVHYLIVDGTKMFEAIKRSWRETTPYIGTIFLVSLFFVVANELFGLIATVMSNAGILGSLYSLAYFVFSIIFWFAYQAIAPAYLYVKMTGGVSVSEPQLQEDIFVHTTDKNSEEWDF